MKSWDRSGKLNNEVYVSGKLLSRGTYSYDRYGYLNEVDSLDAAGNSQGRGVIVNANDGTRLRDSQYSANGQLAWEHTYDPETKTEHFTTFDESGTVKLSFTFVRDDLIGFWELPGSPQQLGDNFAEDRGQGNVDNYACHNDLHCDVSHIQYKYLTNDKRMPTSAEWRDEEGNLKFAAYFDYDIDSDHNWTGRRVSVWSPELGSRSL